MTYSLLVIQNSTMAAKYLKRDDWQEACLACAYQLIKKSKFRPTFTKKLKKQTYFKSNHCIPYLFFNVSISLRYFCTVLSRLAFLTFKASSFSDCASLNIFHFSSFSWNLFLNQNHDFIHKIKNHFIYTVIILIVTNAKTLTVKTLKYYIKET